MKIYTQQNDELMQVTAVKRQENCLYLKGKIMKFMPLSAEVRPEEIRAFLKMLGWKDMFFLVSMLFRPAKRVKK